MPSTSDLDDPAAYVARDNGPLDLSSLGDLDASAAPTEPSAAERSELRDDEGPTG
jgi:hypothetical protein